ncbi:hypothetical protein BDK51DRAFT_32941 [Blyttiomyces helicus]|uniref:Peptidase M14 domain-containing protein n=1 Tax=Blyttiomyces helicus TaxID=388810 RepID=A0A4P9WLF4_9FUNG|nr:hypothetical protein BDK51DRAFT_32941 [Blyttiomyces helicus]|eukprot:RKO93859.1 hypothetical protein BDK51DRAFT_32941 [Blyttiomyces helicus]
MSWSFSPLRGNLQLGLLLLIALLLAPLVVADQTPLLSGPGIFFPDEKVRFDGHAVLRISRPTDPADRDSLDNLLLATPFVDVWSTTSDHVDVRVSPEGRFALRDSIELVLGPDSPVRIETIIPDVQALISLENMRLRHKEELKSAGLLDYTKPVDWFSEYHRADEIYEWYVTLAAKYPSLITVIPSIGKSYEGRDIFAVKITNKKFVDPNAPKGQFWFHGGQHAREWIGSATVQFISHHLLEQFGQDEEVTALLNRAEFIIVPLMNPDGNEYCWKSNRLWRKNRRPVKRDVFGSVGVDLNRNWPEHWSEAGSSNFPYSDVYHGPQLVLRPYGTTYDDAPDEKLLKEVGDGIRDLIKGVHGKTYVSQREIDLYAASGTASDWFYGDEVNKWLAGRRLYAYTIELRPSANEGGWGGQGFILPPEQIIPTGSRPSPNILVL